MMLGDDARDVAAHAAGEQVFLGGDDRAGVARCGDDGLLVQRAQAEQVHHPRLDSLVSQVAAASSAAATMMPQAMMARSLPCRTTLALPIAKSSSSA